MKLLNAHVVKHDQGSAVYILGKLNWIVESEQDWERILLNNVVHISKVYRAYNDPSIDSDGFPNLLSQVTFDK